MKHETVVAAERRVTLLLKPDDAIGVAVVEENAEIKVAAIKGDAHFRRLPGGSTFVGLLLAKPLRRRNVFPERLVQPPIERDRLAVRKPDRPDRRLRVFSLREHDIRASGENEQKGCGARHEIDGSTVTRSVGSNFEVGCSRARDVLGSSHRGATKAL